MDIVNDMMKGNPVSFSELPVGDFFYFTNSLHKLYLKTSKKVIFDCTKHEEQRAEYTDALVVPLYVQLHILCAK